MGFGAYVLDVQLIFCSQFHFADHAVPDNLCTIGIRMCHIFVRDVVLFAVVYANHDPMFAGGEERTEVEPMRCNEAFTLAGFLAVYPYARVPDYPFEE